MSPLLFPEKKLTTFLLIIVTLIDFTRVSPPAGCHPAELFYLSDLVCPLFSINLPTKYFLFFGCHQPEGVTLAVPPHSLVPPLLKSSVILPYSRGRTRRHAVAAGGQRAAAAAGSRQVTCAVEPAARGSSSSQKCSRSH